MTGFLDASSTLSRFALLAVFTAGLMGKLAHFRAFRETVGAIEFIPSPAVTITALAVLAMEATSLVLLIVAPISGALLAVAILVAFSLVSGVLEFRGHEVTCSCFGGLGNTSLGRGVIVRNLLLLGGCALILAYPDPNVRDILPLGLLGATIPLAMLVMVEVLPEVTRGVDETLVLMEQQERAQ